MNRRIKGSRIMKNSIMKNSIMKKSITGRNIIKSRIIEISKKLRIVLCFIVIGITMMTAIPDGLLSSFQTQTASAATNTSTVELNKKSLILGIGRTFLLKVTGTTKAITWKTSNSAVATVTSKRTVKGEKTGTSTITAKVGDSEYQCKVSVYQVDKKLVQIMEYDEMFEGGEKDLLARYYSWEARKIISLDLKPA